MVDETDPLGNAPEGAAKILPPDYALKKKIGENIDIKEIFSEQNVNTAQKAIDSHKESFRDWAIKDIAVLDKHYNQASANSVSPETEIDSIAQISTRLQAQAGTFDFGLATRVAKSLANFCTRHPKPDAEQMVVIRKHIETLSVVLNQNIVGDGGTIGAELLDSLTTLTGKYD